MIILRRIVLTDFKCYEATNAIEFPPSLPGQNLCLIGGKNGAGKTALFKAVAMCLYGAEGAFKQGVLRHPAGPEESRDRRREALQNEIRAILNKGAARVGRRKPSVTLVFDAPEGTLEIMRSWEFDRGGVCLGDSLEILRNGNRVQDDEDPITGEAYGREETLKHLLEVTFPPNVSRFFLFDGEEIQVLAQESPEEQFVERVDTLLGFSILKTLENDLVDTGDHYRRRVDWAQQIEAKAQQYLADVKRLEIEQQRLQREQEGMLHGIDEVRDDLEGVNEQLRPFVVDGRTTIADLEQERNRTSERLDDVRSRIAQLLETVVIPSLPGALASQLLQRLEGEAKFETWREGKQRVEPQLNRLCDRVLGPQAPQPTPALLEAQTKFLEQLLRREWEALFHPPPADAASDVRHDRLAKEEIAAVRSKIRDLNLRRDVDLRALLDESEVLSRRFMDLEARIRSAGEGGELEGMLRQRDDLNRRLGDLQAQHDNVTRQLDTINGELKEKRREYSTVKQQIDEASPPSLVAQFCKDMQTIIHRFQERRRPQKMKEVAQFLGEMYRRLARKEDVVQDIEIDERQFRIRLLDRRRQPIAMRELSAGEKEILAISLLWALQKASGRDLPVIIDTPLARLDRDHRLNIVRQYLPQAGPQVLILSTDTEIDAKYLDEIEDRVAERYQLVYDTRAERTRVERGYF